MLKNTLTELASQYTTDTVVIEKCWAELEHQYTGKGRHYHTLAHLENLLVQLSAVREQIADWDTLLFTLFYHDVVYGALKNDNEEESALLARKRMQELGVPLPSITRCAEQILATKQHLVSTDNDTNLFTDADLSILGASAEAYATYTQQIRKEYKIYPDMVYKPGRRKVLQHFLNMDSIFKTHYFHATFEMQARTNLQWELEQL